MYEVVYRQTRPLVHYPNDKDFMDDRTCRQILWGLGVPTRGKSITDICTNVLFKVTNCLNTREDLLRKIFMAQHYLWGINRIKTMLQNEDPDYDFLIAMATFSIFNSMACAINGKHGNNANAMDLSGSEWAKARKYIELDTEMTNEFLWKLARNPILHSLFTADSVEVSRNLPTIYGTTETKDLRTGKTQMDRNLNFNAVSWFRTVEKGFRQYLRDLAHHDNEELRKNLVAYMTNGAMTP